MATLKEYLVLSQIAYNDFDIRYEVSKTIGILSNDVESSLSKYLNDDKNEIWKNQLDTVKDWALINCQNNTKAGFAAAAFRSPEGETVIAFRGKNSSYARRNDFSLRRIGFGCGRSIFKCGATIFPCGGSIFRRGPMIF